jgi:peptidoglycan/LPS O-acetylase OafA/YrhL
VSDPTTATSRRGHIAALDGLRGLAVLAVLFFHAGKLPGGFLGVDLFFALSGFLITSLLLTEVETTHRVDLLSFWRRRFRRLLPAVIVLLVVVTVITTIVASVPERAATINDGPWVQAYLANWHAIAGETGYWASFELPRMFGHLWSLAIEEQFYVVWPAIVMLIAWRTRHIDRALIMVCVVGSALSLIQMIRLLDTDDPSRVYIGTDTRASSVLLGAVFAAAPLRRAASKLTSSSKYGFTIIGSLVVVMIGTSWLFVDGPTSPWLFKGGLFVHSLLSGALVVGCASSPAAPLSRVLGWRPLRTVGGLSYSLYLWHWPVYTLLSEERLGLSGWALIAVQIAVSFVAAVLSKNLVEDPVRFRAPWARGRHGVNSLVGVTLALALFWVVVPYPNTTPAVFSVDQLTDPTTTTTTTTSSTPRIATTSSTPNRLTTSIVQTSVPNISTAAPTPTSTSSTTPTTNPTSIPTTTTTPTTTAPIALQAPVGRALLVGDSVAYDTWPGIQAALEASGIAASAYVKPGAGLLDTKYGSAVEIDAAIAEFTPDLVMYQASLWDFGAIQDQQAAYQRFTTFVLERGARLAFITIPPLRDDQHNDQLTPLLGIMNDLAAQYPGLVQVFDSNNAWGPTFDSDVNDDLVPERKPDGVHVCPSGSALFANWLLDELASRFVGFVPASPEIWATGSWTTDQRYTNPDGICAALT